MFLIFLDMVVETCTMVDFRSSNSKTFSNQDGSKSLTANHVQCLRPKRRLHHNLLQDWNARMA